ncbi:MAG: nuclear transport factor 2 family protein [Chloroflexi bacterium]|nr:nuclear transport factor 2 family protein [Chloroflexota bacterium]
MGEQENRAVIDRIREATESGDMQALTREVTAAAADDFVQEWPQSGERFRGVDKVVEMYQHYPSETGTTPKMSTGQITGSGDVWVMEGTVDYGDGIPVRYVGIAEFRDGKVSRLTEYYANPFEAPEWRSQWAERM